MAWTPNGSGYGWQSIVLCLSWSEVVWLMVSDIKDANLMVFMRKARASAQKAALSVKNGWSSIDGVAVHPDNVGGFDPIL